MRSGDPSLLIAYLRVSTDEQQLGIEAQRNMITTWADRRGARVIRWFEDLGVSGGAPIEQRPALSSALAAFGDSGAGILVVARRDRLARDAFVALMVEHLIKKKGGQVKCADGVAQGDTAEDAFLRHILDAVSEYERKLIGKRISGALQALKRQGAKLGTPPYGSKLGKDKKSFVPDHEELEAIEQLIRMNASGMSARRIAAECVKNGILGRSGKPFTKTTIIRILAKAKKAK